MKNPTKKLSVALLSFGVCLLLPSIMHATVLLDEPFTYPDGSLTNNPGWVTHSGTGSPIQVANGSISLVQGAGSREDDNHALGSTMGAGDTWFYAFDLSVSSGSATVYFAHFMTNSTTFNARLFVTPLASFDYTLGISGSSTLATSMPTGFGFGATNRVIMSYDFGTGGINLWVNTTSLSSPSLTTTGIAGDLVSAIGFRQAGTDSTELIDNLLVGTSALDVGLVPEPSTVMLASLGGLVLLTAVRRHRR